MTEAEIRNKLYELIFAHPMSQTKPANYTLARQAIMMAYTLLAPDERTTTDLNQHLANIQREELEREATRNSGGTKIESFALRLQRELFFEAFDALANGLNGKWY